MTQKGRQALEDLFRALRPVPQIAPAWLLSRIPPWVRQLLRDTIRFVMNHQEHLRGALRQRARAVTVVDITAKLPGSKRSHISAWSGSRRTSLVSVGTCYKGAMALGTSSTSRTGAIGTAGVAGDCLWTSRAMP